MSGWLSLTIGVLIDAVVGNWYLIVSSIGIIFSIWYSYSKHKLSKEEYTYEIRAWDSCMKCHPSLDSDAKDLAIVLAELNQQGARENLEHLGLLIPQSSWCRVEKPFLYVDFMVHCTKTDKPVLKIEIPCIKVKVMNDCADIFVPSEQRIENAHVFHVQDLKKSFENASQT